MKIPRTLIYEVYDGDELLSRGTSKELGAYFDCRASCFHQYASNCLKLFKRYTVKAVGAIPAKPSSIRKKPKKPRPKFETQRLVRKQALKNRAIYSQDIHRGMPVEIFHINMCDGETTIDETCRINAVYRHIFTVKRKAGYIESFTFTQLYREDGVRLRKKEEITIQCKENTLRPS